MPAPLHISPGQQFGRLTIVREADRRRHPGGRTARYFLCRCACGTETEIFIRSLTCGRSTSCGCFFRERVKVFNKTHGDAPRSHPTPEYVCWQNMIRRCTDPDNVGFKYYGARGISVCKRWLDSYAAFLADMGRRPSPKHSIDRKDNDGNYEPGNCRWATAREQNLNKGRKAA